MDNKKLIHDTVVATLTALSEKPKPADCYKATEARLYAYPVLMENIKRYKLDIRDLKREKNTEKSKDITCWGGASGVRLTPEERQAAKIMAVEIKLEKDTAEVSCINKALLRLERMNNEDDVQFVKRLYFQGLEIAGLAEFMDTSPATLQRRRTRLVRQLALMLYGAEALQ